MKIICVGQNYHAHNAELNSPTPSEPVLFSKPDSAILLNHRTFFIPSFSKEIHHEVELLVKICKVGKNIEPQFANRYYNEIGLGIDFTARDIQRNLKEKGLPWEKSKAFDSSAVIGDFLPKEHFENLCKIPFHLEKNNTTVQIGNSENMIFNIDTLIVEISKYFTLKIGDILFTGTPSGVSMVNEGDELKGYIENQLMLSCSIR